MLYDKLIDLVQVECYISKDSVFHSQSNNDFII